MALPAVIMAYKERDNAVKLVVYIFVGIAVIYFLWKVFGVFHKIGESIEKAGKKVKEKVKEYAEDPVQIIRDAVEMPAKPVIERLEKEGKTVDEWQREIDDPLGWLGAPITALNAKKHEKVKPTYKTNKEIMEIEGKRWLARAEKAILKPAKPTYKTNEELAKIYGERWQAIARYYKRRRPASPLPKSMRIKPVLKPVPKYRILPVPGMGIAL